MTPGDQDAGDVLVLTLHTGGHYFGEMLHGLLRQVAAAGRHAVVAETRDPGWRHGDRSSGPRFTLPLAWNRVAGVVCIANSATPEYLAAVQDQGIPVVLASQVDGGFHGPVALPSNRIGVAAAVRHLVQHGHTRIGFVGSLDHHDFRERLAAYRDAMAAHGLAADDGLYFPATSYAPSGGEDAARLLLARPDRPTAVITATDGNAFGLIDAVTRAGLRVPQDLAVFGFDNVEEGAFSVPSLSSVGQRFHEVGALAGRLLLDLMHGVEVPAGAYNPDGIVMAARASCGCRDDLLGELLPEGTARGPEPRRPVRPGTDELRRELDRSVRTLVGVQPSTGEEDPVRAAIELTERLASAATEPSPAEVGQLVQTLRRLAPEGETLQLVATDLVEHVQQLVPTGSGGGSAGAAGHGRVDAALRELQARGYRQAARRLDASAIELESVAAEMLRTDAGRTRGLGWLAGTQARAGVLALWDRTAGYEHGRLTVEGVYDSIGAVDLQVGEVVDVRDFPGAGLARATDGAQGEMCVVVPVASTEREWGLLAVLGAVDTTSVREVYHLWAQLLLSTLEGEQLEDAVRLSEERYAWAAQASNDGLWDLETATRRLYLSERCRDLVGVAAHGDVAVDDWTAQVVPEDLDRVRSAFRPVVERAGVPVEVEYRLLTGTGQRWVECRAVGIAGGDGTVVRVVGSLSDVTTRKELEEQLRQAALYDAVTGLPNRRLFLERLSDAVDRVALGQGGAFAVLFLDLDGFKSINDSLGHLAGDQLLQVIADGLRDEVRAVDTAARFGGDEFAVLLTDLAPEDVLDVARRIRDRIARPVDLGGREVRVTVSAGVAASDDGYASVEDVLRDADAAMYRSKSTAPGTVTVAGGGVAAVG